MAQLHDALLADGYAGHPLEVLLVRLLFCLFAEDTAIFDTAEFRALLEEHTAPEGHDLGAKLGELFAVLDTPKEQRSRALAPHLANFPYVNGALFSENFRPAVFTVATRQRLIDCTYFDWSRISPAVFGSLFQSIADPKQRRTLGAHYTSEPNILKVLDPLLLDGLRGELAQAGTSRPALTRFQNRLAGLRLLDPACGCGNFLVVVYRELRLLEHEVLDRLYAREVAAGRNVNLALYQLVRVEQVAGIEVEEFAARIAEVALWLMDHQLNLALSARFDQRYVRLPLTSGASIHNTSALTFDWNQAFADKQQIDYIVGNPPFVGKHLQTADQKSGLALVCGTDFKQAGDLDFVAAWFIKAAQYMRQHDNKKTTVAFVSTNTITQGEQVPALWQTLLTKYKVKLHFAHRTFKWSNEAKGNAAVHCVIIGFADWEANKVRLFDYERPNGLPQERPVSHLSPYLLPTPPLLLVQKHRTPLAAGIPEMRIGNKPSDAGHLLLSEAERQELVAQEPAVAPYIKRFVGADEFINNTLRWCLWLRNIAPSALKQLPQTLARVNAVREFRLKSSAAPTRKAAGYPTEFFFTSQPSTEYILVPAVSSEKRKYIPIGFMQPDVITGNANYLIAEPSLFLFGVLTSEMFMAWVKTLTGRLKSDIQFSGSMVYNNYPFPSAPTEAQRQAVATAAEGVLAARASFAGESLAALYDPGTMPPALARAHQALDRAVDKCYRSQPFATELARLEFLFGLYQQLSAPVLGVPAKKRR
jgi:hypothetical protein